MKKSDLVLALAEKEKITEKQAFDAINLIFEGLSDALIKGDKIELRGFGSFIARNYGTYTGRNPRTGENIEVKPKRSPFFKVGRNLKLRVDNGK